MLLLIITILISLFEYKFIRTLIFKGRWKFYPFVTIVLLRNLKFKLIL